MARRHRPERGTTAGCAYSSNSCANTQRWRCTTPRVSPRRIHRSTPGVPATMLVGKLLAAAAVDDDDDDDDDAVAEEAEADEEAADCPVSSGRARSPGLHTSNAEFHHHHMPDSFRADCRSLRIHGGLPFTGRAPPDDAAPSPAPPTPPPRRVAGPIRSTSFVSSCSNVGGAGGRRYPRPPTTPPPRASVTSDHVASPRDIASIWRFVYDAMGRKRISTSAKEPSQRLAWAGETIRQQDGQTTDRQTDQSEGVRLSPQGECLSSTHQTTPLLLGAGAWCNKRGGVLARRASCCRCKQAWWWRTQEATQATQASVADSCRSHLDAASERIVKDLTHAITR